MPNEVDDTLEVALQAKELAEQPIAEFELLADAEMCRVVKRLEELATERRLPRLVTLNALISAVELRRSALRWQLRELPAGSAEAIDPAAGP